MAHCNTKHPEENFVGLWSVEKIKEFIRREQQQKQPEEEVRKMCLEEKEDVSPGEGHRRMIACPTATKFRDLTEPQGCGL